MTTDTPAIIAVFGSSQPLPKSPAYERARAVGFALAREGWTVVTGGYRGVMEAASRGAKEAGGTVLGVTTSFRFTQSRKVNPYVDREIRMPSYGERLLELLRLGDGYVVLRGGSGTLAELFLAWEMVKNTSLPGRPIILFGAQWRRIVDILARELSDELSFSDHLNFLRFAETPEEMVRLLRDAFSAESGGTRA
jgi:hypothetical protein